MLEKVKRAMHISTNFFDEEILDLIQAGIADIQHAGAKFDYVVMSNDYLISDPLARTAVITYCRMRMGSPADHDRLKADYDEQKGQLREARAYGMEVL